MKELWARGRLMVCTWLMYSGFFGDCSARAPCVVVKEALTWFAQRRTGTKATNPQTVQQPSQRRCPEPWTLDPKQKALNPKP